jgi:hypothetical protein
VFGESIRHHLVHVDADALHDCSCCRLLVNDDSPEGTLLHRRNQKESM